MLPNDVRAVIREALNAKWQAHLDAHQAAWGVTQQQINDAIDNDPETARIVRALHWIDTQPEDK